MMQQCAMKDGRVIALDTLRGVAISTVLVWHYFVVFVGPMTHNPIRISLGLLWTGVDLFFVLSGYLIGGILLDNRNSASFFSTFYRRRAFRILPLYWLSLCLFVAFGFAREDGTPFWTYLLFLQNFAWGVQGRWGPDWTGPTWSLAIEEHFYLVLPLLIRFLPSRHFGIGFLAFALLGPVLRTAMMLGGFDSIITFLMSPCRFDPLFLGVFAAWLVRNPVTEDFLRTKHSWLVAMLVLLAGGMVVLTVVRWEPITPAKAIFGYLWIVLFYFVVLLAMVTRPMPAWMARPAAVLSWLGIGAYSIYLFHFPLLLLMRQFIGIPGATELAALGLTFATAIFSWKFIEQPAIRYAKQRFQYYKEAEVESPAEIARRAGSTEAPHRPSNGLEGGRASLPLALAPPQRFRGDRSMMRPAADLSTEQS